MTLVSWSNLIFEAFTFETISLCTEADFLGEGYPQKMVTQRTVSLAFLLGLVCCLFSVLVTELTVPPYFVLLRRQDHRPPWHMPGSSACVSVLLLLLHCILKQIHAEWVLWINRGFIVFAVIGDSHVRNFAYSYKVLNINIIIRL